MNAKNVSKKYPSGMTTKNINALSVQRHAGDPKVNNFTAKSKLVGVSERPIGERPGYTGMQFRKEAVNAYGGNKQSFAEAHRKVGNVNTGSLQEHGVAGVGVGVGVQPGLNLEQEIGDKMLAEKKRGIEFERYKQEAFQRRVAHAAGSEDSVEDNMNVTANSNANVGGNTGPVIGGQNSSLLGEKKSSLLGERNMDRENRRILVKKDNFIERGRDREGVPSANDNTDGTIVSKEAGGRYYSDMKLQKENNDPLISGVTTAVTFAQRN